MALAGLGLAVMTQAGATGGLGLIIAGLMVAMVGLGPGAALTADIVVGSAPPEKAGSAASVSETSGEFGIALGIAVLGSLGTAIYRSGFTAPAGTPADVAATAEDTLAGAVAAAPSLPAEIAVPLLDTARDAFMNGLNVVAGVGSVAMLAFAVAGVVLFRRFQPPATQEAPAGEGGEAAPSTADEPPADTDALVHAV